LFFIQLRNNQAKLTFLKQSIQITMQQTSRNSFDDSIAIMSMLIAAGAEVNAVDEKGITPLMHLTSFLAYFNESSNYSCARILFVLLDSGADIYVINNVSETLMP
jgi:hypothetical protein